MRFTKEFWPGIADGSITVAFRRWRRPTVVAGRPYRTGGGRVEVVSVEIVDPDGITAADARRCGHPSAETARAMLPDDPDRADQDVYRVEFRLLDEPDPRQVLADSSELSADDIESITARLERLDNVSKSGSWTAETLQLIADHPATRAPDLAESVGRETKPFKLDVRKLKNLGLTTSLRVGYELSPRGKAYLSSKRTG